jgi:putative hydrolase
MSHPELVGDFHVHSTFSDDAVSTVAENIAAASAAGLSTLRLIDHVRESTTWVPEFAAAVAAEPVPDGLTVHTGVEAKLLTTGGDVDIPAELRGVGAVVLADHQWPSVDGPLTPDAARRRITDGLAPADALDEFIAASIAAMTRFHAEHDLELQLAHWFSILPKVGLSEDALTDGQLASWASTAAATGTVIEANEKWGCPGPRALRAAIDAGVRIVASTDSHVATDVGRYDRVVGLLDGARA